MMDDTTLPVESMSLTSMPGRPASWPTSSCTPSLSRSSQTRPESEPVGAAGDVTIGGEGATVHVVAVAATRHGLDPIGVEHASIDYGRGTAYSGNREFIQPAFIRGIIVDACKVEEDAAQIGSVRVTVPIVVHDGCCQP